MPREFQEQIDSALPTGILHFPVTQELAGPVVINGPLKIVGNGVTIWASRGPAIQIDSDGVELSNLRVEVSAELPRSAPLDWAL
jgi:hypothetical protein